MPTGSKSRSRDCLWLSSQSAGVRGSSHVETEALRRGLDLLQVNRLSVDHIVTDRHARVQKYLRKRNVRHYYNIQHLEKGRYGVVT